MKSIVSAWTECIADVPFVIFAYVWDLYAGKSGSLRASIKLTASSKHSEPGPKA